MTILGQHTVGETRDIIKVVQYRIDEVSKAFLAITDAWKQAHPTEYAAIARDWSNVVNDWHETLAGVETDLDLRAKSGVSEDNLPAEDDYKRVLGFVEYGDSTGVQRRPGDLRDTQSRIEAANGKPVDLNNRPDISKRPDTDHQVYIATDQTAKALESRWTFIGIGAAGVLGLYALKRIYFPRL